MARATAVDRLSEEDRKWLDDALFENNFQNYEQLAEQLQNRGYKIGKSSVHRYGKKFEDRLQAIEDSTQAAIYMAERMPDDAGALTGGLLNMLQTEFFTSMVDARQIQADSKTKIDSLEYMNKLSKVGTSIAKVSIASVNQKKWQVEMRDKTQKAADAVANIASKGGLNDVTVQKIRREILGIAD